MARECEWVCIWAAPIKVIIFLDHISNRYGRETLSSIYTIDDEEAWYSWFVDFDNEKNDISWNKEEKPPRQTHTQRERESGARIISAIKNLP